MKSLWPRLLELRRHWPSACIAVVVTIILIHEAPGGQADSEPLSLHPYVQQVAHTDGTEKSAEAGSARVVVGT